MEKKITKAQMFAMIKEVPAVAENDEMVAFIDHELELLAKKSASKKPTKKNEENEVLKAKIVEVLGTFENGATVSEILGASEDFSGMSNQKISALLTQLVKAEKVVRTEVKGRAHFALPSAED
jgi:DNA replicative helicase MCM subunit Mcm2 (Cdc46/Mcm family)